MGNGVLTVNPAKKSEDAIYVEAYGTNIKLIFENNITLNLYAKRDLIHIENTTTNSVNNVIELKNGQTTNIKKEVYNYDSTNTKSGFNLERKKELNKITKKSNPDGTYGYSIAYRNVNGTSVKGYCIYKLIYSNELNAYLSTLPQEFEFIKMTDWESSDYSVVEGEKYSNCLCEESIYNIYKDKNGKEYVVNPNRTDRIYDIKEINDANNAWCHYLFIRNDNIQFSDLTPYVEHIVINGCYTYYLRGNSFIYKPVINRTVPSKFEGTVKLKKTSYTYDGKAKKPAVIVKDNKGNSLKNGTDYTISYQGGRKKVGEYKVKVTFKGKYTGTKELSFKIKPKGTSLKSVTAGKKKFKVTWKKQKTQTTGYEVQYATNKAFTSGKKTIKIKKNKTTSSTVKKLKSKKKYYVRIRTYKTVNGKKYCSGWSKAKNIKVK